MAAQNRMRAALLGAPVVDQHRGLALLLDGIGDFRVGHELDLNPIGTLRQANRKSQKRKVSNSFHWAAAPPTHPGRVDHSRGPWIAPYFTLTIPDLYHVCTCPWRIAEWPKIGQFGGHLMVTAVRFARPGGLRSIVAESVLLRHPLLILNRGRKRAPNLRGADRISAVCVLFSCA